MLQCLPDLILIQLPIAIRVKMLVAPLHICKEYMEPLKFSEVNCARSVAVMYPARSRKLMSAAWILIGHFALVQSTSLGLVKLYMDNEQLFILFNCA